MNDALQITAAVGILFFVGRWLLGSGNGSSSRQRPNPPPNPPSNRRRQVPEASIEQIRSMFPQVSVAAARYDLERTGSIETTTERVLRDGYLADPPAGYYPDLVAASTSVDAALAPSRRNANEPPSLIVRLGLQSRIEDDIVPTEIQTTPIIKGKGKAMTWAPSAEDREKALKERKAKMVLEARRQLLEKEQAKKAKATSISVRP